MRCTPRQSDPTLPIDPKPNDPQNTAQPLSTSAEQPRLPPNALNGYPTAIIRQRVAWRAHKRKLIREKHRSARLKTLRSRRHKKSSAWLQLFRSSNLISTSTKAKPIIACVTVAAFIFYANHF